jgi:NAD-dependent SIR2 family protein deacetylase
MTFRTVTSRVALQDVEAPNPVWFGEEPQELNRCYAEVHGTDDFIVFGTSGCGTPERVTV